MEDDFNRRTSFLKPSNEPGKVYKISENQSLVSLLNKFSANGFDCKKPKHDLNKTSTDSRIGSRIETGSFSLPKPQNKRDSSVNIIDKRIKNVTFDNMISQSQQFMNSDSEFKKTIKEKINRYRKQSSQRFKSYNMKVPSMWKEQQ